MKLTMNMIMVLVLYSGSGLLFTDGAAGASEVKDEKAPGRSSPFSAVRWHVSGSPHVQIEGKGKWYELVSIDGVSGVKIADYCRKTYEEKARKRFCEDLPDMVMPGMNVVLKKYVSLKLKDLKSGEVVEAKKVEMSTENRRRLREVNRSKEELRKRFEPHTFRVEANRTEGGHVEVKLVVLEINDVGEPKWEKVVSRPHIVLRDGQRGTVKISGPDQVLTMDVAKPLLNEHVVVMLTIEQDGKLMMAESKTVTLEEDAADEDEKEKE